MHRPGAFRRGRRGHCLPMQLGRALARVALGGIFVGHGTQKLFGWFGGPGLEGWTDVTRKLELAPPRRLALAAALSETVGGTLLALGALTPLAGSMLTGTMVTAIRTVHWQKGFWNTQGGYEFNLALIAGLAAIIDGGPGRPSVDAALGIDRTGHGWALAALATGAAGSLIVTEAGRETARLEAEAKGPTAGDDPAASQQPQRAAA
jgi:putative oxidoreductase